MSRAGVFRVVLGAALVLAGGLGVTAFVSREPVKDERSLMTRPTQIAEGGYASSRACKSCHPLQYETWHDSFHRTMTQVASPESVVASFDGRLVDAVEGRPMKIERLGDEFWADFDDPDWKGQGLPQRLHRQVVMMTGSHQQQVYWYQSDDRQQLSQLPATYLIKEQRWVPRESVFLTPPAAPVSATGRWDNVCIHCHTTHGTSPQDPAGGESHGSASRSKAIEFGIACEACHGPSDQHALANRSPLRRYLSHLTGRPDPTTIQPARLEPHRSAEVCGQCHGIWFYDERTKPLPASLATLLYRPGDQIDKTRFLVRPSVDADSSTLRSVLQSNPTYLRSAFWSDGMVRVSGREYNGLVDSPCFARAIDPQRTMTCESCHTLHKPADDRRSMEEWAGSHQVSPGKEGNDACLGCHPTISSKLTAHTRHQANSSGSACYNCHMPYTTYGLLRAQRSHQISSPRAADSVATGRPNACNACHLDKSLSWTAGYLADWYGQPQPSLDEDQRNVSAAVLWLLRGDAGQRALISWAMGWQPAQRASGTEWMAGYLSGVLDDDYAAIRLIGYRSLRTLPGFETFEDHAVGSKAAQRADVVKALDLWRRRRTTKGRIDSTLLFNADGSFRIDTVQRLVAARDQRPIRLNE